LDGRLETAPEKLCRHFETSVMKQWTHRFMRRLTVLSLVVVHPHGPCMVSSTRCTHQGGAGDHEDTLHSSTVEWNPKRLPLDVFLRRLQCVSRDNSARGLDSFFSVDSSLPGTAQDQISMGARRFLSDCVADRVESEAKAYLSDHGHPCDGVDVECASLLAASALRLGLRRCPPNPNSASVVDVAVSAFLAVVQRVTRGGDALSKRRRFPSTLMFRRFAAALGPETSAQVDMGWTRVLEAAWQPPGRPPLLTVEVLAVCVPLLEQSQVWTSAIQQGRNDTLALVLICFLSNCTLMVLMEQQIKGYNTAKKEAGGVSSSVDTASLLEQIIRMLTDSITAVELDGLALRDLISAASNLSPLMQLRTGSSGDAKERTALLPNAGGDPAATTREIADPPSLIGWLGLRRPASLTASTLKHVFGMVDCILAKALPLLPNATLGELLELVKVAVAWNNAFVAHRGSVSMTSPHLASILPVVEQRVTSLSSTDIPGVMHLLVSLFSLCARDIDGTTHLARGVVTLMLMHPHVLVESELRSWLASPGPLCLRRRCETFRSSSSTCVPFLSVLVQFPKLEPSMPIASIMNQLVAAAFEIADTSTEHVVILLRLCLGATPVMYQQMVFWETVLPALESFLSGTESLSSSVDDPVDMLILQAWTLVVLLQAAGVQELNGRKPLERCVAPPLETMLLRVIPLVGADMSRCPKDIDAELKHALVFSARQFQRSHYKSNLVGAVSWLRQAITSLC
jgi:hypothetical protein